MPSKCANPDHCEQFRYLPQGRLFQLDSTPEVQAVSNGAHDALHERFGLCDQCYRRLKVVWDGTRATIVSLPVVRGHEKGKTLATRRSRKLGASAGHLVR